MGRMRIVSGVIEEKHRSRLMLEASIRMFFRQIKLESVAGMRLGKDATKYIMMDNELDLFKQWGEHPEYLGFESALIFTRWNIKFL